MQTNKITQWAALLLTFSGMAALSLNTHAASFTVSAGQNITQSGSSYDDATTPALYVNGGTYNGTNITLTAVNAGRDGSRIVGGRLELTNSVVNVTNSGYGLNFRDNSVGVLQNVNVSALNSFGLYAITSSVTMVSSTVQMTGGVAVYADVGATINITGGFLSSAGNSVFAAMSNSSVIHATNVTGSSYFDLMSVHSGGSVYLTGGTYSSARSIIKAFTQGADTDMSYVVIDGVSLHADGDLLKLGVGSSGVGHVDTYIDITIKNSTDLISSGYLLNNYAASGTVILRLDNVDLSQTGGIAITDGNPAGALTEVNVSGGSGINGNVNQDGSGDLIINLDNSGLTGNSNNTADGTLTINGTNSVIVGDITGSGSSNTTVNLDNSTLTGNTDAQDNSTIIISGSNGTVITGTIIGSGSSNTTVNLDNSTLNGGSNAQEDSTIIINGTNSIIIGDITGSGSSNTNVNLDNSSVTGDVNANDDSTINISGSKGSSLTGDINSKDNGTIIIDLDDSKYNGGDINSSGSSNITISGSNGSSVTGTANSKDDSTITINIDGPGSSWIGDTNQDGDSKIIININNGGSGTGGFNGGDLNVGSDSEFTFDKDSHGNNGHNDGTWNIGNKDVTFDNMDNNGKIVIDVDSDDLSHGSFDVTGTASGTGKITVNVTGSTAASQEDQDRIINDLVKGNGKDVWEFDPIEWGLKEEDVVVGPDGNLYVKDNGKLSTAGNIAVGLIAAQKGSWFAQQNSLMKRMGELRLLNDAYTQTVTVSGKEDKDVAAPMLSADKLLENVWIRAYGQQLNYGSSVTGQAFRQYVYGTDIGTDHKWTLDRNNALFTGIFAGYGAADTDHRHYGSKSDISNYYFGLYASWLNVDGWYLDATLKAQYADLHLDGYANGVDYFTGSYNNWSVGGSLEFGKQIKFKDDWFVEPQLQANYLHLLAEDYTMSQGLNVNTSDLDALQLRFGIIAGKTLKLKNGGALQPYVKISGVEMVSSGGKLTAMGTNVRPNLDGARAELGAGIIWQLDAHNQLHLDYEASFGDKYDKPWGLTAGYRYQF